MELARIIKDLGLDKPAFLMCPPNYFNADPEAHVKAHCKCANVFYSASNPFCLKTSKNQWANLRKTLSNGHMGSVKLITPLKKAFDQTFTRDAGLSIIKLKLLEKTGYGLEIITISSKFSNEPRNIEIKPHKAALRNYHAKLVKRANKLGIPVSRTHYVSPYPLEGGDFFYDPYRGCYWGGYSPMAGKDPTKGRTSIKAHKFVSEVSGVPVISLEVAGANYHLDTSGTALPGGEMALYPHGISKDSYSLVIKKAFEPYGKDPDKDLFIIGEEDAKVLAPNAVHTYGRKTVFPPISLDLQAWLEKKDYRVDIVDLKQFNFAGGGGHCLTFRTNYLHMDGGYHKNPELYALMVEPK